jgi:inorganic pyrophosphatase
MEERNVTALDRIPPRAADGQLRAIVETPQGSRNKLKYEPVDEVFRVSCSLPAGMAFPFDFGFIPGTRSDDGDPLDVLILLDAPAYPGCLVEIKLLGVLEADETERSGQTVRNARLIAVAKGSTERGDLKHLKDLAPNLMEQIESFFMTYNALDGKEFEPRGVHGPKRADRLVQESLVTG